MLTIFAITMSMTSGIATAVIVKRLDNIVKLYTQVKYAFIDIDVLSTYSKTSRQRPPRSETTSFFLYI